MKTIIISLIVMSSFSYIFAQTTNPLEFFPHQKGDIFEYVYSSTSLDYFQNIIKKDSLGENGKYYLETSYFGEYIIDTNSYKVYSGYKETLLLLKLNAVSGDVWTVFVDSPNGFVRAKLANVFQSNILGEEETIKIIDYTRYEFVDTTEGLYVSSYYLASKFGIIAEYGDPPFEPAYYLRGAKIDGKIYGTITSVDEKFNNSPNNYNISQNYPNPFNPTTTIEYQIPPPSFFQKGEQGGFVSLKVYDILGKEVTTLVEGQQKQGNYKVNFDARDLSSGVYFYRLTTEERSITKKMILIR